MSDNLIKRLCSICLSTDRKLSKLCWIPDGINLFYMLLTRDSKAYKEGFFKDGASLLICWECGAIIYKIKRFQIQACIAQMRLASIIDGRSYAKLQSLSNLSTTHNNSFQYELQAKDIAENFIDCGPAKDVKAESDSDDLPLSCLLDKNDIKSCSEKIEFDSKVEMVYKNFELCGRKIEVNGRQVEVNGGKIEVNDSKIASADNFESDDSNFEFSGNEIYVSKIVSSKNFRNIDSRNSEKKLNEKMTIDIELMKNDIGSTKTIRKAKKIRYSKYFTITSMSEEETSKSERKKETDAIKKDLPTHMQSPFQCYRCVLCNNISYTHIDIIRHLKKEHKKFLRDKIQVSRKNMSLLNEPLIYSCTECDLSFRNKDLRWKHVQKAHREGFKCSSCDKKFAFKSNLNRHERSHQGPMPREECQTCHKMVRCDLLKEHSRIHTDRQTYFCVECDKSFVSRGTFESHLKYARAHATVDVCRYNCSYCPKRYRSKLELSDHVNYQHNGKAEYKCHICGKGLATKRCIRRHIRRTHEGIKENAKDKICQQCGKAFRDKKSLIEHERVHSGARPLTCTTCGRAFRQRAALYAHTRRLHPPVGV